MATTLFGGVQVFGILISIVRSKFVAVLLGTMGMGIAGLYTSALGIIGSLTNLGLSTSAVKDVSAADACGDKARVETVVSALRRIIRITGALGMLLTICLSSVLSEATFGSKDYTLGFIFLSVTVLFGQLSSGQLVVLQGKRMLRPLALANLLSSFVGLIVTVPMYFFFGVRGIVPAIIITSFVALIISTFFAWRDPVKTIKIDTGKVIAEGRSMFSLGLAVSVSGILNSCSSYALRAIISNSGGVGQVGLYNAGFTLVTTYVGMVFTAMGTEYLPRLSASVRDARARNEMVNQQAEIAMLILAPIIIFLLVFVRPVIILLYSKTFVDTIEMVQWTLLGMFLRAAAWAISFLFLARGAARAFIINEFVASLIFLALNVFGYNLGGLAGIGIAFLIGYAIYLIQVTIVCQVMYRFRLRRESIKVFCVQGLLIAACMVAVRAIEGSLLYIMGSGICLVCALYSIMALDARIGLRDMVATAFLCIKRKPKQSG
jgi:O-antigen/teichoic acid export membrane protein